MHGNEETQQCRSPRSRPQRRPRGSAAPHGGAGSAPVAGWPLRSEAEPVVASLVVAELAIIRAAENVVRSWRHGGYGIGLSSNLTALDKAVADWRHLVGAPELVGRQLVEP